MKTNYGENYACVETHYSESLPKSTWVNINFQASFAIMGIQGLLPLLKPIHKEVHLSQFAGQTIGVDTYCWLHKGAYGCAMDIVEGKKTQV